MDFVFLYRGGIYMEKNKTTIPAPEKQEYAVVKSDQTHPLSETWAQDALQDLDDFIESQGIYIRQ